MDGLRALNMADLLRVSDAVQSTLLFVGVRCFWREMSVSVAVGPIVIYLLPAHSLLAPTPCRNRVM